MVNRTFGFAVIAVLTMVIALKKDCPPVNQSLIALLDKKETNQTEVISQLKKELSEVRSQCRR